MNKTVKKILDEVGERLIDSNQTIAIAESVTAGLIQSAFGDIENAQQCYQGGITTYNLGQKTRHLDIEPIHALRVNSVSPQVANQMASNVCSLFLSDWGIGITGYASPVPESDNKVFAYYSIAFGEKIADSGKIIPDKKDPAAIKEYYLNYILERLQGLLNNKTESSNLDITV